MTLFRHFVVMIGVTLALVGKADAQAREGDFYRNLWNPTYHAQRLSYCTLDGRKCGLAVASEYCKMMGYARADEAVIDYNVGITNYILTRAQCKGWRCNGFRLITCVDRFSHKPEASYYYRSLHFALPRFDHYRVAWCYENGQGCGQRAAYSFCRRMGYARAKNYKKQDYVPATKALGNQRLCFGKTCSGFSDITCYR